MSNCKFGTLGVKLKSGRSRWDGVLTFELSELEPGAVALVLDWRIRPPPVLYLPPWSVSESSQDTLL